MREDRDDAQRFDGVAHHDVDVGTRCHLPRFVALEVRVRRADEIPRRFERATRLHAAPRGVGVGDRLLRDLGQRRVGMRCGSEAVALLLDDGGDARGEIAEVVGKIRVETTDQPLVGEVAVIAVHGVGEHVVAEAVDTDVVDEIERIDHVSRGFRHLLAADEQPSAHGPAARRFDSGRHEHRGPVHAVEAQDVLADEVPVDGPALREARVVAAVSVRRDVVGEGVEPHVRDVRRIPRQGNAPRERATADGEVGESALDEPDHLVAPERRRDRVGMALVPLEQAVLESRETEEPVLFLDELDRTLVDRAVAALDLRLDVVGLARDAVVTAVHVLFDVARRIARLEQSLYADLVAVFRRANEILVAHVQPLPRIGEERSDVVDESLRSDAGFLGRAGDLQTVFVGSGEKVHVVTEESVPAAHRIGDDRRVRVTEVRLGVDVVDRGGCRELCHLSNLRWRRAVSVRRCDVGDVAR